MGVTGGGGEEGVVIRIYYVEMERTPAIMSNTTTRWEKRKKFWNCPAEFDPSGFCLFIC